MKKSTIEYYKKRAQAALLARQRQIMSMGAKWQKGLMKLTFWERKAIRTD